MDNELIVLEAQIDEALAMVKEHVTWFDDFYPTDAVDTALVIYQDNRQTADSSAKQALDDFEKIRTSVKANSVKRYAYNLSQAVKAQLFSSQRQIVPEHQEYCERLTKYFVEFCKYSVYLANPNTRTDQGNPDKPQAIKAWQRKRSAKVTLLISSGFVLAYLFFHLFT